MKRIVNATVLFVIALFVAVNGIAFAKHEGGGGGSHSHGSHHGWKDGGTPPGASHGKKKGWHGEHTPPGLAKNQGGEGEHAAAGEEKK